MLPAATRKLMSPQLQEQSVGALADLTGLWVIWRYDPDCEEYLIIRLCMVTKRFGDLFLPYYKEPGIAGQWEARWF